MRWRMAPQQLEHGIVERARRWTPPVATSNSEMVTVSVVVAEGFEEFHGLWTREVQEWLHEAAAGGRYRM